MFNAQIIKNNKWFRKLCVYQRIALAVISFVLLILVVFFVATYHLQKHTRAEAEQKLHQNLAAQLVEDNPLLKDGVYDYPALKNLFHTLMLLGPRFEFYYLDQNGTLLSHSIDSDQIEELTIDIQPIRQFVSGDRQFPMLAQDPKYASDDKIFSAAPVYNNGQLQGYLYILIANEGNELGFANIGQNHVLQGFSIVIIGTVITLLIALLILFKLITAPLRQLSADMQAFRQAGYQLKRAKISHQIWCADSRSEIDKLGLEFNELLVHIDKQFQALKSNDAQRKLMLADLSHDLRTPLASMQGYMETIHNKGSALSESDRNRFVSICMRNMQNLKHLIDQIFELAYLDSGETTLRNENCSIVELLHDIKNKFEGAAAKKNIKLTVNAQNSNCIVNIDIGKLERVLSNLLENAIRYTPESGRIIIGLHMTESNGVVFVEDTGKGIEKDDVTKIFNARYQGKNKLLGQDKHVGLGLAISQKLVDLFGSKLEVESQLGVGTRFFFSLNLE